jgi:hypothetical protein
MPEVISKYPDITIKVLQGAGARCGEGAPQRILTRCPQERFCSTPTGEICVYGLDEIPQATQISRQEIIQAISEKTPSIDPSIEIAKEPFSFDWLGMVVVLLIGMVLGAIISKRFFKGKPR